MGEGFSSFFANFLFFDLKSFEKIFQGVQIFWQVFKKFSLKKYKNFVSFSPKNDQFCEHTAGRQKFLKKSKKIFKIFKFFLKKLLTNKFPLC